MTSIQLVVFDMAGTTIDEDNVVYKTLHKVIKEIGYDISLKDVLTIAAGKEKFQAIIDILKTNIDQDNLSQKAEQSFLRFKKELDEAYSTLTVKTFPGVDDFLIDLRKNGIKVVLNTGYNSKVASLLLDKLGWTQGQSYDALITADDVDKGRPAPDMIQKAMTLFSIEDSSLVLKAGDSIVDVEEGKNAGCSITVGVLSGAQTKEQLASAKPTYILNRMQSQWIFL